MPWPFSGVFQPLHEGEVEVVEPQGRHLYRLHLIDLGMLRVPSGRLLACDPFVTLPEGVVVEVPSGTYPVTVTVADVSEEQDGSHLREAYLSLLVAEGLMSSFSPMTPIEKKPAEAGYFYSVYVDAGTVAFVDEVGARTMMPDGDWESELFDSGKPDSWFEQMDASAPLATGYANITLPLASSGENLVLSHSGWGDGAYPVVGSWDRSGRLLAVHIDLQVVGEFTE